MRIFEVTVPVVVHINVDDRGDYFIIKSEVDTGYGGCHDDCEGACGVFDTVADDQDNIENLSSHARVHIMTKLKGTR
jgi:hypothetical protein